MNEYTNAQILHARAAFIVPCMKFLMNVIHNAQFPFFGPNFLIMFALFLIAWLSQWTFTYSTDLTSHTFSKCTDSLQSVNVSNIDIRNAQPVGEKIDRAASHGKSQLVRAHGDDDGYRAPYTADLSVDGLYHMNTPRRLYENLPTLPQNFIGHFWQYCRWRKRPRALETTSTK